jgi:hypothetical protein
MAGRQAGHADPLTSQNPALNSLPLMRGWTVVQRNPEAPLGFTKGFSVVQSVSWGLGVSIPSC